MIRKRLLENKIVLITGGGTGIGFGTAKRMVEEGAIVYITGRRIDVLNEAAQKIGGNIFPVQADISIKEDMLHVASVIKEMHGKLDALFANAGYCLYTPIGGEGYLLNRLKNLYNDALLKSRQVEKALPKRLAMLLCFSPPI